MCLGWPSIRHYLQVAKTALQVEKKGEIDCYFVQCILEEAFHAFPSLESNYVSVELCSALLLQSQILIYGLNGIKEF